MTLRSRVGRGTAVTLHGLPAVAAQALPRRDDPLQAGLLTGLRVCLVEDDRNVLRATSALLERWGCTVQAETEADGWRTDCDILVVDYDLGPHASGVECIERVRRQRGEAIPALVISGHDIERIQASVEDTNIALLSKPVRPRNCAPPCAPCASARRPPATLPETRPVEKRRPTAGRT